MREKCAVVCAVIRLENESELSRAAGRSATDALLGGCGDRAFRHFGGSAWFAVTSTKWVALDFPKPSYPRSRPSSRRFRTRVGWERACRSRWTFRVRWGAKIADPELETDPDQLIGDARAAVDKAERAGEPGSIDCSPSVSS